MNKAKWQEFRNALIHPLSTFEEMRYKNTGSVLIATIFVFLFFLINLAENQFLSFRFNTHLPESSNILLAFATTSLLTCIAVVANWGISTLWDGKASLRIIYIIFGYSLCPYIVSALLKILLSHILIIDEVAYLNVISGVGLLWMALIIWFGTLEAQEYTIRKNIACLLLTLAGIVLIIALCFLIILLFQQLFSFIGSVVSEILMRFE